MSSDDERKLPTLLTDLIDRGTEITGSITGSIFGFLAAGIPGVMVGSVGGTVVAYTLQKIGTEIANRVLGNREKVRVGATIVFTVNKIEENINKGMKIRNDDFFTNKINERSPADEICEGVLIASQREYQEKKIKFYANLLANIGFYSEIDRAQANRLIKLANHLSYRQLCILAILANKDKFKIPKTRTITQGSITQNFASVLQEIYDLYTEGLASPEGGGYWLRFTEVVPGVISTQGLGWYLYQLMELEKIETLDLEQVASLLKQI